jgi:hypothetical protein
LVGIFTLRARGIRRREIGLVLLGLFGVAYMGWE